MLPTPGLPDLQPSDIHGLKFFSKHLQGSLQNLHTHHDDPKRILHYDQYLCLLLLAYYNPVLNSLRALQAATHVPTVQRKLSLPYASLGSLSEASRVFEFELLRHLFEDLAKQAQALDAPQRPPALPDLLSVIAADSSLWKTLPRMAKALYQQPLNRSRKGGLKGHIQFDILKSVPVEAHFTPGALDDRHILALHLRPDVLYVIDRGYQDYSHYAAIQAAGSSFLARLREDSAYSVVNQLPLSTRDHAAGVYFDAVVRLGSETSPDARPLRVLKARLVSPPPHNLHPRCKGGKHKSYTRNEPLIQEWILVTDRLDLDADLLVLLYHYRWKIELFFRWLKCTLNFQHLFCESENGMQIQFYAALIASLLVLLYTGRKPNKRIWEILQLHFSGWAEWKDVEVYIAKYTKPTGV